MKKKIKIAAGFLTAIFCILLGCERREREPETLFLEEASAEACASHIFSGQGEPGEIWPEEEAGQAQETDAIQAPQESASQASKEAKAQTQDKGTEQASGQEPEPQICVVHICGAVNAPGVYTLERGERLYQAVEKAGGFREDAQQDYLNQADLLSDGMKIYVPTRSEVQEAEEGREWIMAPVGAMSDSLSSEEGKDSEKDSLLVNINTAGEEQLCTLPGVGSSKAKSIIAYREQNGAYRTIEEIMNVEGIKDGVFRKIKDSITV